MSLPPLPSRETPWSTHVYNADHLLRDFYRRPIEILAQGNYNVHRIQHHRDSVLENAIPLLVEMEDAAADEGLPRQWLSKCADHFARLVVELENVLENATGGESSHIHHANPIHNEYNGKRGRPRKVIDPSFLRKAFDPSRRIKLRQLARRLKIHPQTLKARLRQHGINHQFSVISDHELDSLVREFHEKKPDAGIRYLTGFLRSRGLRLQKRRILASLERIDKLGRALRRRRCAKIDRRPYKVSRPNALWHIDGHHKLIMWGFVIHGCVDGCSRLLTGLQTSTNNRPSTVLRMFLTAVRKHGMPSRVRGDRGWENKLVSILMIIKRGRNRGSFLWGSSTHNTRIERLWLEIGTQFARAWRAFFSRLEELHGLDRTNPHHLWLLHYLFLDLINDDCKEFQEQWNTHPISREGHDQSPQDMFFLGQLEHGLYEDCRGVDPDLLNHFYGVTGEPVQRLPHQTGAGHPADEEGDDSEEEEWYGIGESEEESHGIEESEEWYGVIGDEESDLSGFEDFPDYAALVNRIGEEDDSEFNQDPIEAPKHADPFQDDDLHAIFLEALDRLQNSGAIPRGYGVHSTEWGDTGYPSFGTIRTGLSGRKELRIALPDSTWRPRSVQWAQGLYLMNQLIDEQSNHV